MEIELWLVWVNDCSNGRTKPWNIYDICLSKEKAERREAEIKRVLPYAETEIEKHYVKE